MSVHENRLNAFRPDLADERLKGKVAAAKFVAGRPARIAVPVADVHAAPATDAGVDTQFLCGDEVSVFEAQDGWAWVQAERDGYVGYVTVDALTPRGAAPTHHVVVPRTFAYPGADMKRPRSRELSMGCCLEVTGMAQTRGTTYSLLASGEAVVASHLAAMREVADDYVAVAETLLAVPYLWGGTSGFGVDCSGLVQLSMRMAGRTVLRDTDMQASALGAQLEPGVGGLRRGDLVFWKGHVAIMTDAENVIHASGSSMLVSREPLDDAIERIGRLYGAPTLFRRP